MNDSLQPRGTGPRARPTPGVLSPYRLTGVAAPMAVWALHLVVVYSLQGVVCGEALDNRPIAGLSPLAWAVLGLTVASLAGLGWMALRAWRGWRAGNADRSAPATAARRRFLSAITAALCVLSAVAVLFTTIPVLLLPGCA